MCLGVIRSNVHQIADLNGHGRTKTAAKRFGSLANGMVAEQRGMLLSNNLEVRERDLCLSKLVALKRYLAGRQSSDTDTGVEISCRLG